MARLAKLIDELIRQAFSREANSGDLHAQYEAFQKVLIADLSVDQFADMYAQTIAYGLFAARCNHDGPGFRRELAGKELPKTNPFLRRLFNTIAGNDLDERIAWAVDDLSELLARADMEAILADFGKQTRQHDPVVHFYETFLAAYDPKLRELRGVYYTPEPVVDYIVRSVDSVLKSDFALKAGIADASEIRLKRPKEKGNGEETYETHRVQILDPACGTGTFSTCGCKRHSRPIYREQGNVAFIRGRTPTSATAWVRATDGTLCRRAYETWPPTEGKRLRFCG
jgi:hypothetical protein